MVRGNRGINNKIEIMSNYEKLVEEHNSPSRDLNKVTKYFTLCNNEGMNLKAFNFLTNKKPDLRWSSGKI